MKSRIFKLIAVLLLPALTVSCMTTYDAYGNPVQSVSPGSAAAIAIGAAAVGAAVARNNTKRNNHYHYGHGGYVQPTYYHHGRACYYRNGHRHYY